MEVGETMKEYTLICDVCGKKEPSDTEGYPYKKGWRYLHNISIKLCSDKSIVHQDKHFCAEGCMIQYITRVVYPEPIKKTK